MTSVTPSPMPTPDLAGLLRKPARLLQPASQPNLGAKPGDGATPVDPASTTSAATWSATHTVEVKVADPNVKRPSAPGSRAEPAELARVPPPRQYLRSIAVYLPRSLHQALRVQAARSDTTATALILAAVNSTHDRITDGLVLNGFDDATPRHPNSLVASRDLFTVPQARRASEPTVQTTIRVTDSQHQALNTLATEHGIARSILLASALRLYLAGRSEGPS